MLCCKFKYDPDDAKGRWQRPYLSQSIRYDSNRFTIVFNSKKAELEDMPIRKSLSSRNVFLVKKHKISIRREIIVPLRYYMARNMNGHCLRGILSIRYRGAATGGRKLPAAAAATVVNNNKYPLSIDDINFEVGEWTHKHSLPKKEITGFEVFAYDFESTEYGALREHVPYLLAVTRPPPSEPLFFEGIDVCRDFFRWLFAYSMDHPKSYLLFLSFNGANYDIILLLRYYFKMEYHLNPYLKYSYGKGGGGGVVIFSIINKISQTTIIFRDVIQYLPANVRGSLHTVCAKIQSSYKKKDIPGHESDAAKLALLHKAGNHVLSYDYEYMLSEEYQLVKEYCAYDTYPLFEIAVYANNLFASIDDLKKTYFDHFPDRWQPWAIYFIGCTLANVAFKILPFCIDKDPSNPERQFIEKIDEIFYAFKDPWCVRMCRAAIFGGRCLAPGATKFINTEHQRVNISAVDVSSMYPQALMAPVPAGIPFVMPEEMRLTINSSLVGKYYRPQDFNPFISLCRIRKPRIVDNHLFFTNGNLMHSPAETIPPLPYRNWEQFFTGRGLGKPTQSSLQWIGHTDDENLYCFYNSYHVLTAMECEFDIELVTTVPASASHRYNKIAGSGAYFPILTWPLWSEALKELYSLLYKFKNDAKQAKRPDLEAAYKLLLNGTIGKFAQRPTEEQILDSDQLLPLSTGLVSENRILYQINGFVMASKDRITLGMMSWVLTDNAFPSSADIAAIWGREPTLRRAIRCPLYGDTDNTIFLTEEDEKTEDEKLRKANIMADGLLGPALGMDITSASDAATTTFLLAFRVEPEFCSGCKHRNFSQFFIVARKFYLLKCRNCGTIRTKCKGHRVQTTKCLDCPPDIKSIDKCTCDKTKRRLVDYDSSNVGLRPLEFLSNMIHAFADKLHDENALYSVGSSVNFTCTCNSCLQERLVYALQSKLGKKDAFQFNSGSRFSIKKKTANAKDCFFQLFSSSISRAISISIPFYQFICPVCKYCCFAEVK